MADKIRIDNERQAKIAGRYEGPPCISALMQRVEQFQMGLKEDEEIGLH